MYSPQEIQLTVPVKSSGTSASMRLHTRIREATQADLPRLIEIAGKAFRTDAHTQLKAAAQSPPISATEYMSEGMQTSFPTWLENPDCTVVVANILGKGEPWTTIAGFIVFSHRNLEKPYDEALIRELISDRPNTPNHPVQTSGTIDELAKVTDKSMADWTAWFLSNDMPCMYIMSYCVDPTYQHRGIGPALLEEVMDKADEAKVPCWVQSSDSAWKIFKHRDFKERGRLQVDLDEWCVGVDGVRHEGDWGKYVWRYMERMPKNC